MNPLKGLFPSRQTRVGEVTAVPCYAVNTWLVYFPFERSKSLVKHTDSNLRGHSVGCQGRIGTTA